MKNRDSIKTACDRAIQNIICEGVSDVAILERPFEIRSLQDKSFKIHFRDEIIKRILANDFSALKIKPIKHVLIPKKTLADFRNCAIVDIVDEAIYLSLVLTLANRIEKKRVAKSKNTVFSYRFKYDQNGSLFDPRYSFQAFRAEINQRKRDEKNSVMVSCDIASYYDRINLHRLNSTLLSLEGVDDDVAGLIDELLLFWSGRNSYGLPVGSNASRILAEAELIEVDNYLMEHGVSFCRYVDDYRIFAKDAMRANKDLEALVYALKREGLFLNSGKTSIEDISLLTRADVREGPQTKSHEEIDEEKRPLIVTGYSGLIPLKYRKPSLTESSKLEIWDIEERLSEASASILLDSTTFRNLIKASAVQKDFRFIVEIVGLTKKCPQFVPYVVDFVKKNNSSIANESRDQILKYFEKDFLSNNTPEFIRIALSDLYSSPGFESPNLIVRAYLHLQKETGEYLGRVFLERLAGKTTRLETLELRDCGGTMDIGELRALARVVIKGLPKAESNAFLKNLKIHYDDLFISRRSTLEGVA